MTEFYPASVVEEAIKDLEELATVVKALDGRISSRRPLLYPDWYNETMRKLMPPHDVNHDLVVIRDRIRVIMAKLRG